MELVLEAAAGVESGGRVAVDGDSPEADLGRGALGSALAADRTVSRRHVSLRLAGGGEQPKLSFEVVGRNPVIVCSAGEGRGVYRRNETGELAVGDRLSLSLKTPSFWVVRRRRGEEEEVESAVLDAVERRERRTRERQERERRAMEEMEVEEVVGNGDVDLEVEGLELDLSFIDPVREFGFLLMGHEFDNYPRGKVRPVKDWNWFLEETGRNSDDEDDKVNYERNRSKGKGMNKKKGREGEDEEWTGESEDEKDFVPRGSSSKRPKYATSSKDPKKPRKKASKDKGEDKTVEDEEYEEEDEEDETLGGFIVDEEEEPMEEETEEEEEEEEFDDEADDD